MRALRWLVKRQWRGSQCDNLVRFGDGELGRVRAWWFRRHLRRCNACHTGLVDNMQLSAQLSQLKEPPC